MASGTIGDSHDDLNSRARCRWTENSKVYTRKIRKKSSKACSDRDTFTTTSTSAAENSTSAAPSTSRNPTLSRDEISCATVATPTAGEISTVSTSDDPSNFASAFVPSIDPGSLATTTSPYRTEEVHVVPEYPGDVVKQDMDSDPRLREHSPHQALSLSHGPQHRSQEQLQYKPSAVEGNCPSQNILREGSSTAELQNLDDLPLPSSNEAQDLKNSSSLSGADELLPSEASPHIMRDPPPLSNENNLPNVIEVDGAQLPPGNDAQNDVTVMPGSPHVPQDTDPVKANGVVRPLVKSLIDERISFKFCKETPEHEVKELRETLQCELDQVRRLVKQLDAKELQVASYDTQISNSTICNSNNQMGDGGANIGVLNHPQAQHPRINVVDRRLLVRVNSEMGAMRHQETRPTGLARVNSDMGAARNIGQRPYGRQLSVAVMENNHRANEFVEKEKRTPKANQYYRNSEFLLGKDRLPPESNKRLKTKNGRKHSREPNHGYGFAVGFDKKRNQVFKNCSSLLQRLMKHKYGWVFNEPVNPKALGCEDYYDVIKNPMDFGTIKTRLSQNWYKSPWEFAEDIRLVFRNAMTYNPNGHDVHTMAEQLLQIFEERWAIIETEYNPQWRYPMYQDGGLLTPTSGKAPPQAHFAPSSVSVSAPIHGFVSAAVQTPAYALAPIPLYAPAVPKMRTSDRPEAVQRPHVGRTSVPKKPKAKDLNKRDMTHEEKQRLSTNLQGLPAEKLDAVIQIIKKRNTAISQHDDEIEVDIDKVDTETLWELDRFVTNYKKSLSKNKRKAELALQARIVGAHDSALKKSTPPDAQVQITSGAAFQKSTAPAVEGEKHGYNGNKSSSSSSSSSDSGSSSSDSDSDSSSADESDAGHSPKT